MRQLLLLLCALGGPSFAWGPGAASNPLTLAAVPTAAHTSSSHNDGIVAFGRPHSLVLPTCQRPHVIAHRGGESLLKIGVGEPASCAWAA